jgi:hypothetical protein
MGVGKKGGGVKTIDNQKRLKLIRFARREGKPSSKSTALLKPSINYQG